MMHILRNGHDPVPLRHQFHAAFPGTFTWRYVHQHPEDVAVKIAKLNPLAAMADAAPHCCGRH